MDLVVGKKFLTSTPSARRRLLESASKYIHHLGFLALVHQINPDDARGTQITHICLQLAQFNSNAKLWDQVELWLKS
jgi:hypothetical protein